MRATTSTTIAAATIAAAALIPIAATAPARADGCPSTMTFAVGGVGNGTSTNVPGVGRGPVTRVHYSGSLAPVGTVGGDRSVTQGEHALDTAARAFRARCPQSHITVVGHSMGALVAGNVRDSWSNDPTMRRDTNVVLVSDPRAPRGAMSMLPSVIPGFTHTGPRPASPIPTSSVCKANDAICALGNPFTDPGHAIAATVGYFTGAHGYTDSQVSHAPGRHDLPAEHPVVPDTPLPVTLPTPREVFEPIAQAIVPDAPISPVYTPTPVREYMPPAIKHLVPKQIGDIVLPPVPAVNLPW